MLQKTADSERRALADRITEDVLQLLFTAHQDLREIAQSTGGPPSAQLMQRSQECVLGAISVLRTVAQTVLTAAWGPPPGSSSIEGLDPAVAFDPITAAWLLVHEDFEVLYANPAASDLLGTDSLRIRDALSTAALISSADGQTEVEIDGQGPLRLRQHSLAPPEEGQRTSLYVVETASL